MHICSNCFHKEKLKNYEYPCSDCEGNEHWEHDLTMGDKNMIIKVKKVDERAELPKVTDGNACFDFYAIEDTTVADFGFKVRTGLAFEIPQGYHMKLFMRSSYGSKRTIRPSNCVGIVDSSYRGEVMGMFDATLMQETIDKGERFMQGMIEKNIPVEFELADELSSTERGTGGFGSTGK